MTKFNGADQRQFGRRQTQLHAWISVPGRPRLPCLVRNLSLGGALLELEKPSWLPFNFQLTIESTRYTTMCEVRHHTQNAVGVRFMTAVEYAAVDRQRASNNRSLDDIEAWRGDQETQAAVADRAGTDARALTRSLRERQ